MEERPANPTYEQLLAMVETLRQENLLLRQRVERLEVQLRSGPPGPPSLPGFVKPLPPPRRKRKPGRKEGHDPALRAVPEKIDRTVEVPLPSGGKEACLCPHCATTLIELKEHERLVEDIVPAKPVVTCYKTFSGFCEHCKKRVESRHADQPPAANLPHGQLGLNALTMAAVLKHDAGLPYRKVTRLLNDLCGLNVSPGALPKQMRRMSHWLDEPYQQIKEQLRQSKFVHADETGARVSGKKNWWLWVLTSPRFTLFHLDKSRGGRVPRDLLGENFAGYLISDFFSAYNKLPYRKQKCLVHLLREIRETAEKNPRFADSLFATRFKRLVQDMLGLKKRWDEMDDATYTRRVCRLLDRLAVLGQTQSDDRDVNRLARRIRKHASHLTPFLLEKDLPGDNNAAERAIRPAVVIRKISGGHRGQSTARASAVITSIIRTARQQGRHLLDSMKHLVKSHLAGNPTDLLTSPAA